MAQLGEISFRVLTSQADISGRLDDYFQMHIERCAAKKSTSPLANPHQQRLFRSIVDHCTDAGMVWLSTLSCAGRPIASRFSLRYRDALHLYSTCFSPQFAKFSPSLLQLENLLDYAFDHGINVIDFGIGDSPQKEKAGARAGQSLMRVELYSSQTAHWESLIFLAAQRRVTKFDWLDSGVSMLRRALPYET